MLPRIPYENGASRIPIMQFGGMDRRVGAGNGAITDMTNLTGADVPVLSSRKKRVVLSRPVSIPPYLTFTSETSFKIKANGETVRWDGTIEYSEDGTEWTVWDGTEITASGGILMFRGTDVYHVCADYEESNWIITGENVACSGNIETLLDYATVANGEHPYVNSDCFNCMFLNCTALTVPPALPSLLSEEGYEYYRMFEGCTNLTTLPELPSTMLAWKCYEKMFYNSGVKLSATQTGNYQYPFRIPTSGEAEGATGDFAESMFAGTAGTFTGVPVPGTTYYTDHLPVSASIQPVTEQVPIVLTNPRGINAVGAHLFYVDAGKLYKDSDELLTLTGSADAERIFAALGDRLLVWPDKVVVSGSTATALGASVTQSCTFADGTYAGEAAEGNTIVAASVLYNWSTIFKVGDAVTISGAADAANNKTAIVREISGRYLRFYENTFTVNSTAKNITVARTIPDLDYICVNDNRVWGCKGDTIRCSKLGDPTNWNVFDGLSTDSWSVETGTPGDFTGCVSFMGYPIFFKEDRVFKVYGNRPSNFEVMSSATLGVLSGAAKTMAVAGETLYYLSRAGFVRYNGGYPSRVDDALAANYTGGAAGSDGRRYFVSALRSDNVREFLVYDPETGLWHKEDNLAVLGFANVGNTLYAQTATALLIVGNAASPNESDFASSVTFADFDSAGSRSFSSKYPVRLWLRLESAGAVTVQISYNGGLLETAVTIPAGAKRTGYIPVPIRRCDRFGLKLSTTGTWRLYGMEIETRAETTNRKGG